MKISLIGSVIAALLLAGCAAPAEPPRAPEKQENEISAADCMWLAASLKSFSTFVDEGDLGMVVVNLRGFSRDSTSFATNYSGSASRALNNLARAAERYADAVESGDFGDTGDAFRRQIGLLNDLCQ